MHGRLRTARLLSTLLITLTLLGCNRSGDQQVSNPPNQSGEEEPQSAAELLASGKESPLGGDSFLPVSSAAPEPTVSLDSAADQARSGSQPSELRPIPALGDGVVGSGQPMPVDPNSLAQQVAQAPLKISDANTTAPSPPTAPQPQFQLQKNMTPSELVAFISNADKDMRTINSGRSAITDQREAEKQMGTISRLKLEASRALQDHPDATEKDFIEGTRGEMQSLSHLAGMKNAAAANELMALATKNLKSSDPGLVSDSRIVLIGFGIESLQAGANKNAPDQIVSLVRQFKKNDEYTSVPALMVMAQARNILTQYGYDKQALEIREQILTLFADSTDPTIASLAKQAAGNAVYDKIDKLLTATLDGESTSVPHWREAVSDLIDQAPDLATARYLSSAALEFESQSNSDLANATYDVLAERFKDPDHPATSDVQVAIKLRNARRDVIGTFMNTSYKSIAGAPMPISNFKGKIVLMPFWAMEQPASLQIFPLLREIQEAYPDQVAVVGMNFDSNEAPLEEFLMKAKLDFPSFASGVGNVDPEASILAKFGLASLPFVVILDQEAQVVALDFRGRNIKPTIERMLKK